MEGRPALERLVADLDGSIVSADRLIRVLLEISKLDSGGVVPAPEPIALDQLFEDIAREFALQAQAKGLRHITILQGTKAYGVHTGRAMRVPAREDDALRDHVNFYFDQQDLVERFAERSGCAWTAWRPQIVLGVALGSAMNPVAALGAYAAIQRERAGHSCSNLNHLRLIGPARCH